MISTTLLLIYLSMTNKYGQNLFTSFSPIGQFIDENPTKKLQPTFNVRFPAVLDVFMYNDEKGILWTSMLECLLIMNKSYALVYSEVTAGIECQLISTTLSFI